MYVNDSQRKTIYSDEEFKLNPTYSALSVQDYTDDRDDDEEGEDTDISGTVEEDCVVMAGGVRFVRTPGFEGDLARISATLDRYTDVSYQPDAASIPEEDKRDKTLLIIGDSFGDAMQQVARQYYREVVFIQLTDYEESMIYEHSPDDVIIECVERYLPRLASY